MKDAIRQRARELGFDDCRFTTAAPPESAAHFRSWLEAGRHGGMSYLSRSAEKRANPQLVLPGARSVIALAASYAPSDECRVSSVGNRLPASCHPPLATRHAAIARYARFDDYHDVLGERLRALAGFVNRLARKFHTRLEWPTACSRNLQVAIARRTWAVRRKLKFAASVPGRGWFYRDERFPTGAGDANRLPAGRQVAEPPGRLRKEAARKGGRQTLD